MFSESESTTEVAVAFTEAPGRPLMLLQGKNSLPKLQHPSPQGDAYPAEEIEQPSTSHTDKNSLKDFFSSFSHLFFTLQNNWSVRILSWLFLPLLSLP